MSARQYPERLKRCSQLMKEARLNALLLTKPSNMFYLTGDGRLCAYAMITQDGKVALGVPWGVRVEDTVVVGSEGPIVLTEYPRSLEK